MNEILKSRRFWYLTICWASRVLAGLLAILMLMNIAGATICSGPPNLFTQPLSITIEMAAMLCVICGLIIGMKLFGIGGVLILAGILVFRIIEQKIFLNWLFEIFDVIGSLYLIGWWLRRVDMKEKTSNIQCPTSNIE